MKLTKRQSEIIGDALDNLGFDLHEEYSGRGMYGGSCFGFSTDENAAELKLLLQVSTDGESDPDEFLPIFESMAKNARSDSLGLGAIYYYPHLEWPTDDAPEEES